MTKRPARARAASHDQLKRTAAIAVIQIFLLGVILTRGSSSQFVPQNVIVALPSPPSTAYLVAQAFPLTQPATPLLALAGFSVADASEKPENDAAAAPIPLVVRPPFRPDDAALDDDFTEWEAVGAGQSTAPGILRFGPMRVPLHIAQNVVEAAHRTGSDPALLMAIADKESAFSTAVKARTSSATGLFQFIGKTWVNAFQSFAGLHSESAALKAVADAGGNVDFASLKPSKILQMRNDPYLSAAFAGEMLKRDGKEIANQIGRNLTSGETYLIHFLGKDDAGRFMRALEANPGAMAAQLLPKPAQANRPIFYEGRRAKTIHEVHQAFELMMRLRKDRYRDVAKKLPVGVSAYAPSE